MEPTLAGATAFVTGGAQGIGLAIAKALTERGVRVALADVNAGALERARDEFDAGAMVHTLTLDVRDREAFAEVADRVEESLGPVSLLFNNAGVAAGCHVTQMSYEKWDWVLGVNLLGVVNGIQTFVPRMLQRNAGGYVVNTSSAAGLVTTDTGFLYTTSKYGVVGLSEALHRELAQFGIGVSVLCPGPVATDIVQNTWKLSAAAEDDVDQDLRASLEQSIAVLKAGRSPEQVAQLVLEAMAAKRLHIMTDDLIRPAIVARAEALLEALPGTEVVAV